MSWFGTKEDKELLPDLPEDSDIPDLPPASLSDVLPPPDTNFVKKSVKPDYASLPVDKDEEGIKSILESDTIQKSRFDLGTSAKKSLVPEPPLKSSRELERGKRTEPIYIRLDKFQMTHDSLRQIKTKVDEVEKLLGKIKEIKEKEDKELEAWEHELQVMKSQLDSIDSSLFESL